ncbi:MAG: hypothetical protein Q9164_007263, partial [Protoblastenia rupestris]
TTDIGTMEPEIVAARREGSSGGVNRQGASALAQSVFQADASSAPSHPAAPSSNPESNDGPGPGPSPATPDPASTEVQEQAVIPQQSHISNHTRHRPLHGKDGNNTASPTRRSGVSTTSRQTDPSVSDSRIRLDNDKDELSTSPASSSPSIAYNRTSQQIIRSRFEGVLMDEGRALGIALENTAHHSSRSTSLPDMDLSPPFSPTMRHSNASFPEPQISTFDRSPRPSHFIKSLSRPFTSKDPIPEKQAYTISGHGQGRHPQHLRQGGNRDIGGHRMEGNTAAGSPASPEASHSNAESKERAGKYIQSMVFQDPSQKNAVESRRLPQHGDIAGTVKVRSRSLEDNLFRPAIASESRLSVPSNTSELISCADFGSPDHPVRNPTLVPETETHRDNANQSSESSQASKPPLLTQHDQRSRNPLGHGDDSSSPLQAFKSRRPTSSTEGSRASLDENHPRSPTPCVLPPPADAALTKQAISPSPASEAEQPARRTQPGAAPKTDDTDATAPPNTNFLHTSSSKWMIKHFKTVDDWCKTEVRERLDNQEFTEFTEKDFRSALDTRWGPLPQEDVDVVVRRLGELLMETTKRRKRQT